MVDLRPCHISHISDISQLRPTFALNSWNSISPFCFDAYSYVLRSVQDLIKMTSQLAVTLTWVRFDITKLTLQKAGKGGRRSYLCFALSIEHQLFHSWARFINSICLKYQNLNLKMLIKFAVKKWYKWDEKWRCLLQSYHPSQGAYYPLTSLNAINDNQLGKIIRPTGDNPLLNR